MTHHSPRLVGSARRALKKGDWLRTARLSIDDPRNLRCLSSFFRHADRLLCTAFLAAWIVGIGLILGLPGSLSLAAERSETKAAAVKAPADKEAPADDAGPAKTKDTTFDDVKLDMKKGDPFTKSLLTDKVKKLDGKPIRIRGYILPSFQQTGIKQFVLVRDNLECCFGPGAALFDAILVEMTDGATTDFSVRPVSVEGKFTVKELLGPDGKHLAIYHIDGKAVKQ